MAPGLSSQSQSSLGVFFCKNKGTVNCSLKFGPFYLSLLPVCFQNLFCSDVSIKFFWVFLHVSAIHFSKSVLLYPISFTSFLSLIYYIIYNIQANSQVFTFVTLVDCFCKRSKEFGDYYT